MPTALLIEQLGLKRALEKLGKAFSQEVPAGLRTLAARLVKSIRGGTVTVEEIDSFLGKAPQITPEQKAYLLSRKAWLLCQQDHVEEGLQCYDEALKARESPSTWALKGAALLQMDRQDEAFHAFQQAYLLRENFGPQKQGYLKDLLQGWSAGAALRGVLGIMQHDSRELQKGVEEYLGVLDKARAEELGDSATIYLQAQGLSGDEIEEPASVELQEVIEEWELAVRLLSIKDPFDRWRALTKEISKVWPKDVSAVDAIREQRDREWNR